ncbi:hypothetical protein XH88_34380 [Bradyrhizobium sp. CCBAU 51627]|nr:hypothetical protein [Bradyrhizobium sp. CCBAU 51627]
MLFDGFEKDMRIMMYRMMIAAALLVTIAMDSPVMAYNPGTPSLRYKDKSGATVTVPGPGGGSVFTGTTIGGPGGGEVRVWENLSLLSL